MLGSQKLLQQRTAPAALQQRSRALYSRRPLCLNATAATMESPAASQATAKSNIGLVGLAVMGQVCVCVEL